jgi:phosphatidylglycerophosphate synthase
MNLPTLITVARIALAPAIAWMALQPSSGMRAGAFALYLVVAVSDYWDGVLARKLGQVTSLGKLLDPLADKLFLFAMLAAMYVLQAPADDAPARAWFGGVTQRGAFPFEAPLDGDAARFPLPFWVIVVVLAREVVVTVFRQLAARKGVVIGASRLAKWKTGFQFTWMGAAFHWFFLRTFATADAWDLTTTGWFALSWFNLLVGAVALAGAVVLSAWSMVEYFTKHGRVLTGAPSAP